MSRRHSNAADDLAERLRQSSPDFAAANADTLSELRNTGALGGAQPAYRLTPAQPAKPAPVPAAQSVILPLPPSVNHYLSRTGNGGVYLSPEARNYKAAATLTAQHAGMVMYTCPVAVTMHVYRARRVGDLDNYAKLVLDSLTGIAWGDDAQVVELHAWRHDDAANPRVEVEIRTVTEAQP